MYPLLFECTFKFHIQSKVNLLSTQRTSTNAHPAVEQEIELSKHQTYSKEQFILTLRVFFSQHVPCPIIDTELAETAMTETSPTPTVFQSYQTNLNSLNS